MTGIEQKALELVNAVLAEWGVMKNAVEIPKNSDAFACALLRAIEQHEAFRQEVSDAVTYVVELHKRLNFFGHDARVQNLRRFILAPVDPLEESLADALCRDDCMVEPAERLRAALDARGLAIVKKEAV